MSRPRFLPYEPHEMRTEDEMARRAASFLEAIRRRRTIREFSNRPVSRSIIETCILAAGTAPNGANRQPWHFVAVSDPALKSRIRIAAEREEREFYAHRAPADWLEALAPLGTGPEKPFLEDAPWLIAIFCESYRVDDAGDRQKNYYVTESVGIATGLLITSLHLAGLATLTHTPSPMSFLNTLLGRPNNERPFLLLVVGHAADNACVPDISRKSLERIATFIE